VLFDESLPAGIYKFWVLAMHLPDISFHMHEDIA
jgi:hypothetical protein